MPFVHHPVFSHPSLDQKLWRYMSLAKFLYFVSKSKLWFSSQEKLIESDPWEGLLPVENFNPDRLVSVSKQTISDGGQIDLSCGETEVMTQAEVFGPSWKSILDQKKCTQMQLRKMHFVNCWHMRDFESDTQWRVFAPSPFDVCIQTDFESLIAAIVDSREIYGGRVRYIDFQVDSIPDGNSFYATLYKRKNFESENEFRLVFSDMQPLIDFYSGKSKAEEYCIGYAISVDVKKLVKRILISPLAEPWYVESISEICRKIGFQPLPEKSTLHETGIYRS